MHVTAIIAAAGSGRRLGGDVPKQLLELGGRTILQRSVEAFSSHPRIQEVIVVLPADLAAEPPAWIGEDRGVRVVAGGPRRQDSVANAFRAVSDGAAVVLVHDAARPFVTPETISRAIDAAARYGAAIVAQPVRDTVKRISVGDDATMSVIETLPREAIFLAQTPQAFRREVLRDAVALGESGIEATDEAALAEQAGHLVHVVEGSPDNVKITTPADLDAARRAMAGQDRPSNGEGEHRLTRREPHAAGGALRHDRVGTGYDLHRLVEGHRLILGGIDVPCERGALGHSDADVVCHAATDAILGAVCLGDIGRHFPDTDSRWKDASSIELLRHAAGMVRGAGFRVVNLDVVVVLERPKIAPFLDRIRGQLASVLQLSPDCVSVKGKTNEGMDAVGRGEAVAAHAVALLTPAG
jgi:2-C-methyl-D-erythritol 4-phosphate cytidylyltransferase/2-C-methyl-D-erythritol 2,4-cyclodiphosphate synthase